MQAQQVLSNTPAGYAASAAAWRCAALRPHLLRLPPLTPLSSCWSARLASRGRVLLCCLFRHRGTASALAVVLCLHVHGSHSSKRGPPRRHWRPQMPWKRRRARGRTRPWRHCRVRSLARCRASPRPWTRTSRPLATSTSRLLPKTRMCTSRPRASTSAQCTSRSRRASKCAPGGWRLRRPG